MEQAKFAYNDLVNRYKGKSLFQIVFGRAPKWILDLVALPDLGDKRTIDVNDFVDHM